MLAVAASAPLLDHPWATFVRAAQVNHTTEKVEIAIDSHGRTAASSSYLLRYTRQSMDYGTGTRLMMFTDVKWADSKRCAAIGPMLAGMREMALPHLVPAGFSDLPSPIADGTLYSLSAPTSDVMGEMTISSNDGSTLAHWIDDALRTLAPCWKDAAP